LAFYHDHGFEGTYGLEDPETTARLWERFRRRQQIVDRDPLRVGGVVEDAGETLALLLDGELDVIEVEGPRPVAAERASLGGR
jgi:hypothetical protein